MPRPKKPSAWKVISGSRRVERGPSAGVQVEPLTTPPDPPYWLTDSAAVQEWHRLAPMLTHSRILTMLDLAVLGHLCQLHGVLVSSYIAGCHPKASMIAAYTTLAGAFGITPAMRSKVAQSPAPSSANPFLAFRCTPTDARQPTDD